MSREKTPKSLFLKTSLTLAFGLIIYTGLSIILVFHFILSPMTNRAAEDMAAFIAMVSESWSYLAADERLQLEAHLREEHQLFITSEPVVVTEIQSFYPFIPKLEKALLRHTGQKIVIKQNQQGRCCFWFDIREGEQVVRIGFFHERFGPRPPMALIGILSAACLLILLTTILLVRRITRPVRKISTAANQFAQGNLSIRIPEAGPEELASLAHNFNLMAEELSLLISNRTILFGGISHDLRTPITRMQLALELLANETEYSPLIAGLKNDLKEMERLIQQTLELVKGLEKEAAENINLDELITEIVADYQRQQCTIRWQASGCGVYKIEADALRRVVANLLDNAFRYGEAEPVDLSCTKMDKNLVIHIMDQGPGIPKEQLEAVFQPFFRLDRSRSKKTGGSGLGLAIVQQLCDVHGWKIQLFQGKGRGLDACLIIPIVQ